MRAVAFCMQSSLVVCSSYARARRRLELQCSACNCHLSSGYRRANAERRVGGRQRLFRAAIRPGNSTSCRARYLSSAYRPHLRIDRRRFDCFGPLVVRSCETAADVCSASCCLLSMASDMAMKRQTDRQTDVCGCVPTSVTHSTPLI